MVGKGGRRGTTWECKWNHGNTKHIRVPVALEQQGLEFAHALDSGQVYLDSEQVDKTVLLLIDQFVQKRISEFHPNQHSFSGSTTSRRWDELRRFRTAMASLRDATRTPAAGIALGTLNRAADGLTSQSQPVSAQR